MKRREVRHYIKLILKVQKDGGFEDINEVVRNIIKTANDSWFFNWNSWFFGYLVGIVVATILMQIL
jgi:hypothetical protein